MKILGFGYPLAGAPALLVCFAITMLPAKAQEEPTHEVPVPAMSPPTDATPKTAITTEVEKGAALPQSTPEGKPKKGALLTDKLLELAAHLEKFANTETFENTNSFGTPMRSKITVQHRLKEANGTQVVLLTVTTYESNHARGGARAVDWREHKIDLRASSLQPRPEFDARSQRAPVRERKTGDVAPEVVNIRFPHKKNTPKRTPISTSIRIEYQSWSDGKINDKKVEEKETTASTTYIYFKDVAEAKLAAMLFEEATDLAQQEP